MRSAKTWNGSGLTWDREERQSERLDMYADAADKLRAAGRFYEAWETPTELDLKRKKQLNMGQPPVYDRAALKLSGGRARCPCGPSAARACGGSSSIMHASSGTDGILGDISIDAASGLRPGADPRRWPGALYHRQRRR